MQLLPEGESRRIGVEGSLPSDRTIFPKTRQEEPSREEQGETAENGGVF